MRIDIVEETAGSLPEYGRVPIAFEAGSVLDVQPGENGAGSWVVTERALAMPTIKDYDAIPGNAPTDWPARFDVTNWGFLAARAGDRRLGGVAIAFRSPSLAMLDGRDDLAVLWDIRVDPSYRRKEIGSALLAGAQKWALARGVRQLDAETQNVNVAACGFYARHGFVLSAVNRSAYPDFPEEIQLLWSRELSEP